MRRLAALLVLVCVAVLVAWLMRDPPPSTPESPPSAPARAGALPRVTAPSGPDRPTRPASARPPDRFAAPDGGLPAPAPRPAPVGGLVQHVMRGAALAAGDEPAFAASPDGIREAVAFKKPELLECYEAWEKLEPGLHGRLDVRFEIPEGGDEQRAPREVELVNSDLHATALEGCVVSVFESMRFDPPPAGPLAVTYPLNFDPRAPEQGARGGRRTDRTRQRPVLAPR